jgi:hypothetical protein
MNDQQRAAMQMQTKWEEQIENVDGSGFKCYLCQCPQISDKAVYPDNLFTLCYAPTENKLWFFDANESSETIRMACCSWDDAELIKRMLTKGKSHWMEAICNG